MLANFHRCGIMLVLRSVFNMILRNASPRGPMCFRCLMFSLSAPCELLFLPKLTYNTHIHNISVHTHKPLQIIKALTAPGLGKQKETLMAIYKTVMSPALECESSIWSPLASSTSINKRKVMQSIALRTVTAYTQDINIHHLHDKTLTFPIHEHLHLHASQYTHKTQQPSHHLHKHTTYFNSPRLKKH